MGRIFGFLFSLLVFVGVCSAQSLDMMQQMSADQLEQLRTAQQQSQVPSGLTGDYQGRLGDKTTRVRSTVAPPAPKPDREVLTAQRTTLGEAQAQDKWERLYLANGDSTTISTLDYIDYLKVAQRDSLLRVFGRDLFVAENLTFAPSLSIPTPVDYVVSAGDVLIVTVWGSGEREYELTVSPEGNITVPTVGPLKVGGFSIADVERRLRQRLGSSKVKVTLGDVRSISVNIVGEARTPGTYTLPSLSSVFNALYAAGGVSDIGSLRDIKLYRGGKLVTTLDVYDFLVNGSSAGDVRLADQDLIVVSPYQNLVSVTGNVRRPMVYELLRGESLQKLIDYAGGFQGDAYTQNLAVMRRSGGRQMSMHTVSEPKFEEFVLADKDSVSVGRVADMFANMVSVEGAVWRPGNYELGDSISTVGELVAVAEGLSDDAFSVRAQLVRTNLDKSLEVVPVDLSEILEGRVADIKLQRDDRLIVSSVFEMREGRTITISGEVNDPHTMPYAKGMTIGDAIILAKGLNNSASRARIEVARRVADNMAMEAADVRAEYFTFQVLESMDGSGEILSFELMPFDEIFIRRSPGYARQRIVTVQGEVNFQGEYAMVTVADRLSDLVMAAGGATGQAYLKGASLYRQYTQRDVEKKKSIDNLSSIVAQRNSADSLEVEKVVVGAYYTVGIDLEAALKNPDSPSNITLQKGDRLYLPTMDNTVSIIGAVYYPNTTTHNPKYSYRKYIKQAGGYSDKAKRRAFVVNLNGKVVEARSMKGKPEPGSTIVVPFKEQREPLNAQGWVGISSSVVSMAAMVVSLFR